jgi:hypothetical protein
MDGMVLKGHPTVDLISSMKPYLEEFTNIVELNFDVNDLKNESPKSNIPA